MSVPLSESIARAAGSILHPPVGVGTLYIYNSDMPAPYSFGEVEKIFHNGYLPSCIQRSPMRMFDYPADTKSSSPGLIYSFTTTAGYCETLEVGIDGRIRKYKATSADEVVGGDASAIFRVALYYNPVEYYRKLKHWFLPRFEDGSTLRDLIVTNSACKFYASHCTGRGDEINPPPVAYIPVSDKETVSGQDVAAYVKLRRVPAIPTGVILNIKFIINGQYEVTMSFHSNGSSLYWDNYAANFGSDIQVPAATGTLTFTRSTTPCFRVTAIIAAGRLTCKTYNQNMATFDKTISLIPPAGLTEITSLEVVSDDIEIYTVAKAIGVAGAAGYEVVDNHSDYLHQEVGTFTEATTPDSNGNLSHPTVNTEPKWWDGHATVSSGLDITSSTDITTGAFTLSMIAKWHLDPGNTDVTEVFAFNTDKITFKFTTGNDFEVKVGTTTLTVPKENLPDYPAPLVITRSDTGALKVIINGDTVVEDATGNQDNLYLASATLKYHGNSDANSWFTSTEIAFFNVELSPFYLARLNELSGGKALTRLGVIGTYKDHVNGTAVLLRSDTGVFIEQQPLNGGSFQFLVDPTYAYTIALFEAGDLTGAGNQLQGLPLPASPFTPPDGTTGTHQIGGRTYEGGAYLSATVRVYRQDTLQMLAEVTSAADGNYVAKFDYTGEVVTIVWYANSTEVIPNRTPVVV